MSWKLTRISPSIGVLGPITIFKRTTVNGSATWGKKVTCTVSRNGDLIHRMYLRVKLPDVAVGSGVNFRWLNSVGHVLLKSVEIEIGGQRINPISAEKYQASMLACAA